jgi:translation initiation factor 3 subunit B
MAKKKNEQYSDDEQDYNDEPNFDDPEGFVDDVSDEGMSNVFCQRSMADIT